MSFTVAHADPWLIAGFEEPQRFLSWSLSRPGFVRSDLVAWLQVRDRDLPPGLDPKRFFRRALVEAGMADAVGLMTSRLVRYHHLAECHVNGVGARCLATLDLGNGSHVARPCAQMRVRRIGTINLLCHVTEPLSDAGLLEASSIATQARTAAVLEADVFLPGRTRPVSGTGTDCVVVGCPDRAGAEDFAGLHTAIGQAVGGAVHQAITDAIRCWRLTSVHAAGSGRIN